MSCRRLCLPVVEEYSRVVQLSSCLPVVMSHHRVVEIVRPVVVYVFLSSKNIVVLSSFLLSSEIVLLVVLSNHNVVSSSSNTLVSGNLFTTSCRRHRTHWSAVIYSQRRVVVIEPIGQRQSFHND